LEVVGVARVCLELNKWWFDKIDLQTFAKEIRRHLNETYHRLEMYETKQCYNCEELYKAIKVRLLLALIATELLYQMSANKIEEMLEIMSEVRRFEAE